MRAAVLTVADPEIGIGHLSRCDALGRALESEGCPYDLVVNCKAGDDWLRERLDGSGFARRAWSCDIEDVRSSIAGAELVVVDTYTIAAPVWSYLQEHALRLVVFDDYGATVPKRGIVVNGSPGAELVGYPDRARVRYLLGIDYQVLRPPFWTRPTHRIPGKLKTVGVMMGGTDHRELTWRVVRVLEDVIPADVKIHVIGAIDESNLSGRTSTSGFLSAIGVKSVFDSIDLLISAAGQTVAEAVACLVPTISLQTADNQRMNVEGWTGQRAVLHAGEVSDAGWEDRLQRQAHTAIATAPRRELVDKMRQLDLSLSTRKLARILVREI